MAFNLAARLTLQDDFSSRMRNVTKSMGDVERRTKSVTSGFSGLTKTMVGVAGALGVTALISKGFNTISSSIDGAISRYDTLNNFPKIMQQVGFSADESQKAISRLSDGITGLPTTIDGVAATAQQIGVMTKDINGAVNTTLALNNAFISSGSDAVAAERGMDQYVKSLSKGKFEMDSWTTLQETMGLALNDVAEAFGYTGKSAQNDLYSALKDGHVTFDQFNGKLIELDQAQGGFAERALTASGGIKTAWKNMGTSVVRGVANIIGEIDKALGGVGSIEAIIGKVRGAIDKAFGWVTSKVPAIASVFKAMYKAIKPFIPVIKSVGTAFGIALGSIMLFMGAIKLIVAAVGLFSVPVWLAIGAIAGLVLGFQAAYKSSEPFRKAVDGVVEKVKELASAVQSGDVGSILEILGFSPDMLGKVTGFIDGIKTTVGGFVTYLAGKWEELQPGLATLFGAFTTAKDTISEVLSTLWSFVEPILTALGVAFSVVADIAVIAFNNVIAPAIEFISSMFSVMWKVVGPILELLGAAIGVAFGILKVVWNAILKPVAKWLLGTFKTSFEAAKPYVEGLGEAFDKIGGLIEWATGKLKDFSAWLGSVKIPDWVSDIGGKIAGAASYVGNALSSGSSNYHGRERIPYDGFHARLHRGEKILSRQEADAMDHIEYSGVTGGSTYNNQTYNNVSSTQGQAPEGSKQPVNLTVNYQGGKSLDESEMHRFSDFLYRKINAAATGGA